eukprot:3308937-Pyramimonas_sp.AAC.1
MWNSGPARSTAIGCGAGCEDRALTSSSRSSTAFLRSSTTFAADVAASYAAAGALSAAVLSCSAFCKR